MRYLTIEDLRARVRLFEERYGVPSDRMREAFLLDGQLIETEDLRAWSALWRTLRAVEERP